MNATAETLRAAIDGALGRVDGAVVVAVSGGRDSMALMHAMARFAAHRIAAVATFDHGTGAAAAEASSLVAASARRLGLNVVRGRAQSLARTEASWREARWAFLRRVARAFDARIATAHTEDDQLETVVLRLLRGTGTRGLAALAAPSPHVRPWLRLARRLIASWAEQEALPYVHDPTNDLRCYQRSRVRHDLLPALEAAHPGFGASMLAVAQAAADWRAELELMVDELVMPPNAFSAGTAGVTSRPLVRTIQARVPPLRHTIDEGKAVLWPALMARVGVTVNRRGTAQLIRFTSVDRSGAMQQLAGGGTVVRIRSNGEELFELRGAAGARRTEPGQFRLVPEDEAPVTDDSQWQAAQAGWRCMLPRGVSVTIRGWCPGDRIRTAGAPAGRRVARYLSEARISSLDRSGWPVVLWESEIVWIPGVCRSVAAPNRPGWSDLIWYRCEREHG